MSLPPQAQIKSPTIAFLLLRAGGRIRFTTNSPYVAIHIETDTIEGYSNMPLTGTTGVDVYRRNSRGEYTFATTIIPANDAVGKTVFEGYRNWYSSEIHDYTLNLPSFVNVKKVYIGLIEGSYIDAPTQDVSLFILGHAINSVTVRPIITRSHEIG